MPPNRSPTLKLVTNAFMTNEWAVLPATYDRISEIIEERAQGLKPDTSELAARIDGQTYGSDAESDGADDVCVINLHGVLISRAGMMDMISGATSPQTFAQLVTQAANDPQISTIVISADTPGGTVSGTQVAADAITYAKGKKPVIGVVDDMACSAGIWILSQCSEIVIPASGTVGSIGVIGTHVDRSKALAQAGLKHTVIRSTPGKALGQPSEAMTGKALEQTQARMDALHGQFVQAVATGRGVPLDTAAAWGTGDTWLGQDAVDMGLADRLGTLASVLAELSVADAAEDATLSLQNAALAEDSLLASDGKFQKDARVKVKGKPHMDGHSTGVVKLIEGPTHAYGIVFDGMEDMGVHKWYVESELEPEASDPKPAKKPMKMNGQGETMNLQAITAKLTAGQSLTAEERAFLNTHLDGQATATPAAPDMSAWPAEARAMFEQATAAAARANDAAATAQATATAERDIRLTAEFEKRALAIGQPKEYGATLRKLHDLDPEAATATEQALKAAHAQTQLTATIGTSAASRPGATAPADRIEARAKELEAKGMNGFEAMEQAMKELGAEASEYSREVRA